MWAPQSDQLSVILGYVSVASWLGAQFPQLVENVKRQSVDGLALPFLANWLLGDVTNLIGCLLTNQLFFQVLLASYFCFVDVCLIFQYVYYSRLKLKKRRLPSRTPSIARRPLSWISASLSPARTRPQSRIYPHQTPVIPTPQAEIRERAALNTAMGVAIGASPQSFTSNASEAADIVPSLMYESWQHERPQNVSSPVSSTRERRMRSVSWGPAPTDVYSYPSQSEQEASQPPQYAPYGRRQTPSRSTTTTNSTRSSEVIEPTDEAVDATRGRPLTRPPPVMVGYPFGDPSLADPQQQHEFPSEASGAGVLPLPHAIDRPRKKSASASRRSTGIVFLGVWVLFGWSGMTDGGRFRRPFSTTSVMKNGSGAVLGPLKNAPIPIVASPSPSLPLSSPSLDVFVGVKEAEDELQHHRDHDEHGHTPPPPPPPPKSTEYIIGRISAWACTTLYLTSRLPQIWKNYARKSVEGLTMSLFIFAFLGNFFYVSSLLTNPILNESEPIASEYIRSSIPYLLGSGGTLLFDITIVAQSFIYRGKAPRRHSVNESLLPHDHDVEDLGGDEDVDDEDEDGQGEDVRGGPDGGAKTGYGERRPRSLSLLRRNRVRSGEEDESEALLSRGVESAGVGGGYGATV